GGRIAYAYPDGRLEAEGVSLDVESGRRCGMTRHARWSPEIEAEGPVRMTGEIEPTGDGVSRLTVIRSGMVAGGHVEGEFVGGIVHIVSGLKTLVETGEPLMAAAEAGAG